MADKPTMISSNRIFPQGQHRPIWRPTEWVFCLSLPAHRNAVFAFIHNTGGTAKHFGFMCCLSTDFLLQNIQGGPKKTT